MSIQPADLDACYAVPHRLESFHQFATQHLLGTRMLWTNDRNYGGLAVSADDDLCLIILPSGSAWLVIEPTRGRVHPCDEQDVHALMVEYATPIRKKVDKLLNYVLFSQ